jgi:hypothetical protein
MSWTGQGVLFILRDMKRNQKGFGAIEALIIVAVLAVVGFGGWYITHKNKTGQLASTISKSQTANAADPSDGGKFLVIKEWGVRFPLDASLQGDTTYGIRTTSFTAAYFQVGKIADLAGSNCKLQTESDGTGRDGGIGVTLVRSATQLTVPQTSTYSSVAPHIGQYWYYLAYPKGACSSDDQAETSADNALFDGLKQLSAVKVGNNSAQTVDTYAGWKTYCDNVYHYCFKYPPEWTLGTPEVADAVCDPGGVGVSDAEGNPVVSYQNANNKDGSAPEFSTVSIDKPTAANEDLTIVGGYFYYNYNSEYFAVYDVVDTSTLTNYPLTVGQASAFPQTPRFTDLSTGTQRCTGSLFTQSVFSDAASAKAWFASPDAKTGLQILKSFYYNQ